MDNIFEEINCKTISERDEKSGGRTGKFFPLAPHSTVKAKDDDMAPDCKRNCPKDKKREINFYFHFR